MQMKLQDQMCDEPITTTHKLCHSLQSTCMVQYYCRCSLAW